MVNHTSHSDEAYNALLKARALLDRRRKALATAQTAFDAEVARAVSSEPESISWYDAPGYLGRPRAMEAAGLTNMQLHRLMERYRAAHPPKRARRPRRRA